MGGHKQNGLLIPVLVALCCSLGIAAMAMPSPLWAQIEPTATPDAEGVIYSEVRPNDSLWVIAVQAGITLQELLELNGLSENDLIQPGQLLITGYGTPAPGATTDMPAITSTATRPPPTPTSTAEPAPQTGICLMAFTDTDGDGQRDAGEPPKAAVAFTIFNEEAVIANYVTDGVSEPYCLEGLAAGDYQVTRSVGSDETLTGMGDRGVILTEGNVIYLEFGSLTGPIVPAEATSDRAATDADLNPEPAVETTPVAIVATPAPQLSQRPAGIFSSPLFLVSTGATGAFLIGLFLFVARKRQSKRV
jgi:hypothetical protein